MSSEVAIRRAFLDAAYKLVHAKSEAQNIIDCVLALEAAINTMTDEPMVLMLVTEAEAAAATKAVEGSRP